MSRESLQNALDGIDRYSVTLKESPELLTLVEFVRSLLPDEDGNYNPELVERLTGIYEDSVAAFLHDPWAWPGRYRHELTAWNRRKKATEAVLAAITEDTE